MGRVNPEESTHNLSKNLARSTGNISQSNSTVQSGNTFGLIAEGNIGSGYAGGISVTTLGEIQNFSDWLNPIDGVSGTLFPSLGAGFGLMGAVGEFEQSIFATKANDPCSCTN